MFNQILKKGKFQSPWEIVHGKRLPSNFLKPLGMTALVLKMNRIKGIKFKVKGQEGLLIGFNVMLYLYRIITQSGGIIDYKSLLEDVTSGFQNLGQWQFLS
jgi:hypothetical protein